MTNRDGPAASGPTKDWIARRAKLFECGEYPDKGVTVTPEILAQLEANFREPVPVLIEHATSPLELGFLTQVHVDGADLLGVVQLSPEANALIEASGAKSLSLGLSKDLTSIREVSLVQNPRVADAQLFQSDEIWFRAEMAEAEGTDWRGAFHRLQRMQREQEAARQVEGWIEQGKLLPSQAEFARAILQVEDSIDFDGDSVPLKDLLISMFECQPPHQLFQAIRAAEASPVRHDFEPEEADFYRRYFPDIDLGDIAERKPK